jgi:hypothetical protein
MRILYGFFHRKINKNTMMNFNGQNLSIHTSQLWSGLVCFGLSFANGSAMPSSIRTPKAYNDETAEGWDG